MKQAISYYSPELPRSMRLHAQIRGTSLQSHDVKIKIEFICIIQQDCRAPVSAYNHELPMSRHVMSRTPLPRHFKKPITPHRLAIISCRGITGLQSSLTAGVAQVERPPILAQSCSSKTPTGPHS